MEQFRKNIESLRVNHNGKKLKITCSIGIAKFIKEETLTSKDLFLRADETLYECKEHGRNQVRAYNKQQKN